MRERWEEGSVIGKPRSLAHRVFPAGFRQRFLHLALRTEPIISAWCAVAQLGEQRYNRVASSSLTRTFQRTAISGNSFTYSQKFCEWHTLVFESQAQNRVHVETALIFITPAVLCATGGRHLRRTVWADL